MEEKTIHIVSLDVPYPPDYGGAIDIFYRIKALKNLGYQIILHCFSYGRGEPEELKKFCKDIFFYPRKKSIKSAVNKRPFIVETRKSAELLNRLLADDYPVLLEGLHTCGLLENEDLQKKKVVVRAHNIEHDYYKALKENSTGFRKIYYGIEAKKLKKYEPILAKAHAILAIKEGDYEYFKTIHPNTYLLPASLPLFEQTELKSPDDFCLFHGNLEVAENEMAAQWLLNEVIPKLSNIPFVIAGKNPSENLKALAVSKRVQIVSNPTRQEMEQLILTARVHALPSPQSTGLKLKLLAALQSPGITVVNSNMVEGNQLAKYCIVADTAMDFHKAISESFYQPYNLSERIEKIEQLKSEMNTEKNIAQLVKVLDI